MDHVARPDRNGVVLEGAVRHLELFADVGNLDLDTPDQLASKHPVFIFFNACFFCDQLFKFFL